MNKGPTIEELRQIALERAKLSMSKESGIIMGKLKRLTCLVSTKSRLDLKNESIVLSVMTLKFLLVFCSS